MKRLVPLLAGAVSITAAALSAKAETLGLQAHVTIGGEEYYCRDFKGQVVRTLISSGLGDVARASIVNRMAIIQLDDERLQTLPDKMQVFFFKHECAHHLLGHIYNPSLTSENEADCWAIKNGRDSGLFTRTDVESFAPFLADSSGSPFGHLPGPQRAARLVACFDDPSDNMVDPEMVGSRPPALSASR
jgi:hypothetical protein